MSKLEETLNSMELEDLIIRYEKLRKMEKHYNTLKNQTFDIMQKKYYSMLKSLTPKDKKFLEALESKPNIGITEFMEILEKWSNDKESE